jgi:DNA-binding MarR family transcriptional regulator
MTWDLTGPHYSCNIQPLYDRTIPREARPGAISFQEEIITLIRALGLHRPDQTPCGQPISVAEAQAILELSREPRISQNGLATKLRLEKSTVSRLAGMLERRGWLERTRDKLDSRVLRLRLTAAGAKAARTLAASRAKKFSRVFEAIPPNKRDGVLESLSILSETLAPED